MSGAYRLNELLPMEVVDLGGNEWREVTLTFRGESVTVRVGGEWVRDLKRPNLNAAKRKLLWMLKGGEAGIELDDIQVRPLE